MTKISGTYGLLEQIIRELIERLKVCPLPGSVSMSQEGQRLLNQWLLAHPTTDERAVATKGLLEFQRKALDHLLSIHAPKPR